MSKLNILHKKFLLKAERGAIVIIAAIAMIALTGLMALSIDAAGYYGQMSRQTNASSMVKQAVGAARTTVLNNAEEPGRTIAETSARVLRENGIDGEISVHYFEDTDRATRTDRLAAFAIEVDGTYTCMLGPMVGISELSTESVVFDTVDYYSSSAVWRPHWTNESDPTAYSVDNGTYTWAEGASWDSDPSYVERDTTSAFPDVVASEFSDLFAG